MPACTSLGTHVLIIYFGDFQSFKQQQQQQQQNSATSLSICSSTDQLLAKMDKLQSTKSKNINALICKFESFFSSIF